MCAYRAMKWWQQKRGTGVVCGLILSAAVGAGVMEPARADGFHDAKPALVTEFARYEVVPDEQLSKMRGGFLVPSGILNFAVDVAAQINGHRLYEGHLTYSPSAGIGGGVTQYDTSALGVPVSSNVNLNDAVNQIVTAIQAGHGNVAPSGYNGANGFVMSVQNTLSNVVIQQQMHVRLDLEANRFLESQATTQWRSRLAQLRYLNGLR